MRSRWVRLFLAVTAAAVGMELWFAFDGDKDTPPWTDLVVDNVPAVVTFTAVGVLVAWLPVHFYSRYTHTKETKVMKTFLNWLWDAQPAVFMGTVVALTEALAGLGIALSPQVSLELEGWAKVLALGLPFAQALLTRLRVWAPRSVRQVANSRDEVVF